MKNSINDCLNYIARFSNKIMVIQLLLFFSIFFSGYCNDEKSITLTGSIVEKSFYGPPNFGENPKDDSIEKYFFLLLNKPILYNYKGQYILIKEIQLVCTDFYQNNFAEGGGYTVVGIIQKAETGHHHTDFVLIVEKIANDEFFDMS